MTSSVPGGSRVYSFATHPIRLGVRCPGLLATVALLVVVAVSGTSWGQEQSVRPGVNNSFQQPDVNSFVERFESEGREVYDKREKIVAALELKPGTAVADVGAGTGLFTRLLAKQVGPEGRVYAVDIAREFVDHVEKSCQEEKLTNVVGVVCTADSAKLPPESVDVIFICDTYHHFEYPQKTLASLFQALRPGGKMYVIDFERIEGKSSEWILNHVRAGKEVFRDEILAAGFKLVDEKELLSDNYFLGFRKPAE